MEVLRQETLPEGGLEPAVVTQWQYAGGMITPAEGSYFTVWYGEGDSVGYQLLDVPQEGWYTLDFSGYLWMWGNDLTMRVGLAVNEYPDGYLSFSPADMPPEPWHYFEYTGNVYAISSMGVYLQFASRDPAGLVCIDGLDLEITPIIPEPGTFALICFGLSGISIFARRRR